MDKKDLMIGNLVVMNLKMKLDYSINIFEIKEVKELLVNLTSTHSSSQTVNSIPYSQIHPILITEDWIVNRFGGQRIDSPYLYLQGLVLYKHGEEGGFRICSIGPNESYYFLSEVTYIHELQNAFKVFGIELKFGEYEEKGMNVK